MFPAGGGSGIRIRQVVGRFQGSEMTSEKTSLENWSEGNQTAGNREDEGEGEEEQPLLKKPRLDAHFMIEQGEDGSFSLWTSSCCQEHDVVKGEDASDCVGDCSTCGDVGFQAELFRCTKCHDRLQHTYCSNSYNPRKRWLIGLCNWCEAEVGSSRSVSGASKHLVQGTRRDGERVSQSSWGKVEKMSAVDCLLGAALRLPSAGFNVEDILQVAPRCSSSGKRRKPLSFDTVEKARRSGPSCENAVKSTKRDTEVDTFCSEILKSSDSSLDIGERPLQRFSPRREVPTQLKSSSDMAVPSPSSSLIGDVKLERAEVDLGKDKLFGRAGSCDSEKPQSSTSFEASDKMSKFSPINVPAIAKCARSPRSLPRTNEEKSVGSLDNTSRKRFSNGSLLVEKSGESQKVRTSSNIRTENVARRSPKGSREGPEILPASKTRETMEKTKTCPNMVSINKFVASARSEGESERNRRSSPTSDSTGGSDCSNITEQRSGKEPSSLKPCSTKQQTSARQLVRPNYVLGKSPRSSDERLNKKFSNKDAKLRRTSSKIAGFHNYKSLSDIMC